LAGVVVRKSFDELSQGKDVGKQHDGAEIQHGNNGSQGCLLSNMSNVKVFHLMDFKVIRIKHGQTVSRVQVNYIKHYFSGN